MTQDRWFARVTLPDGSEVIAARHQSLHWAQEWLDCQLEHETAHPGGFSFSIDKERNNIMSDQNKLNDAEMAQLVELGKAIQLDLSCDANGTGLPCRTDRLDAVRLMRQYLDIHDLISVTVSDNEVQVRSIPADPTYTERQLEAVAKQLNTVPLPQEIYEIISDLHSAVMGLMREVRKR